MDRFEVRLRVPPVPAFTSNSTNTSSADLNSAYLLTSSYGNREEGLGSQSSRNKKRRKAFALLPFFAPCENPSSNRGAGGGWSRAIRGLANHAGLAREELALASRRRLGNGEDRVLRDRRRGDGRVRETVAALNGGVGHAE